MPVDQHVGQIAWPLQRRRSGPMRAYPYDPTQTWVHATETDAHGCRPCIANRAAEPQNAMPTDRGAPCPPRNKSYLHHLSTAMAFPAIAAVSCKADGS